jgi:uncharacterized protein YndB with AHSA1/START domain
MSSIHDTFVLERTYPHGRDRVFAALSDPALRERWYSAGRNHFDRFDMAFTVGGRDFQRYILGPETPVAGKAIENDGRFEHIVAGECVVLTTSAVFDGLPISTALITFELEDAPGGTLLRLTHQAVFYPGADGPAMRRQGWDVLLGHLSDVLG